MSQATINVGAAPDDGTGDTLRAAFVKVKANFDELYNLASGSIVVGAGAGGAPLTYTNLTYTETSGPRLQVGSGSGTSAGWILGYFNTSGQSAIYSSAVTPGAQNYALRGSSTFTEINAPGAPGLFLSVASDQKMLFGATAGSGPSITAGTATTDVNALKISQTMNAAAVNFTGVKWTFTQGASGTGGSTKLLDILYGTSGSEASVFSISKGGNTTITGYSELTEMTAPGAGAANTARIYAVDNGAGKTQLMVVFASGSAQQIAIEP